MSKKSKKWKRAFWELTDACGIDSMSRRGAIAIGKFIGTVEEDRNRWRNNFWEIADRLELPRVPHVDDVKDAVTGLVAERDGLKKRLERTEAALVAEREQRLGSAKTHVGFDDIMFGRTETTPKPESETGKVTVTTSCVNCMRVNALSGKMLGTVQCADCAARDAARPIRGSFDPDKISHTIGGRTWTLTELREVVTTMADHNIDDAETLRLRLDELT